MVCVKFCSRLRMMCSLLTIWMAYLLFSTALLLHSGEARVHTVAQVGPLYRVVGSLLSISCNATGFTSDSARQDFEIRVKKPANPNRQSNIISSKDQTFGYAVYRDRVRTKQITLTHASPNSVVFEIQSLQKSDEGEYECAVINSESIFDGIYRATTVVKVIDDSLSVSSPVSASPSYNEGDALTLTCRAASNTVQHTHLSLAWYLHEEGEENAQPIISLDRDFTLRPGRGFERRYQAGLIRLDKISEATYRLTMAELELSDRGRIYCQAHEWIQDPDLSWYSITQKDAGESTLDVKGRELAPDTASLVARLSVQPTALQEGQELSLSCTVDAQNADEKFLSVAWLRGSVELARIGPTGILSVGPEYSGREKEGELRVSRIKDRDYRLILKPVRTDDQGEYVCRAWLQERGQDGGAFIQGAAQNSNTQLVNISVTESRLLVEMQSAARVNEGDRLKLACKVRGIKGQLSISWQRKLTLGDIFADVIGLSQEGVMEKADEFLNRKVQATRPAAGTFLLELDEVTPADSGVYQCAVSEWKVNNKTNSQSRTAAVTVAPTDSFVTVKLVSRQTIVTVGDNVELMCLVRGTRLAVTLTWVVHRGASTDQILTLYANGAISWSAEQQRYQLKVENTQNGIFCYLLVNGVSRREAGRYQCQVSAFQENVHHRLSPSNRLAVMVQNPVSKLVLNSSFSLTRNINADIEIKCSVTTATSALSRYAVSWTLQRQGENVTILSSDRDSLVTFGTQLTPSDRQRISMRRTEGPSFELSIRQAQISDNGSYVCAVEEWMQDPRGEWFQLSLVSRTTVLTLTEPGNVEVSAHTGCRSGIWIGILVLIVSCSLLIIFILVLKICRAKTGDKKSDKSLWAELQPKPSADD